jgi:hypothetical protein
MLEDLAEVVALDALSELAIGEFRSPAPGSRDVGLFTDMVLAPGAFVRLGNPCASPRALDGWPFVLEPFSLLTAWVPGCTAFEAFFWV